MNQLERISQMNAANGSTVFHRIAGNKQGLNTGRISLLLGFLCLLFANSAVPAPALTNSIQSREYRIKAEVVYNLLKFIEWPDELIQKGNSLSLCIVGNDSFGSTLDTLNSKLVQGVFLNVTHLPSGEQFDHCHAVFLAQAEHRDLKRLLEQVSSQPLLTIGESDDFIQKGGMIGLLTLHNRVRFNINLKRAKNNGLMFSYQLLRLARNVIQ